MQKNYITTAIAALLFSGGIMAQDCQTVPFAVVELFTSQGCSSCPTAEQILNTAIASDKNTTRNVIYIAEHVTYWDYLGWTDPYGDAQFKSRQTVYANVFNASTIYTPQLLVNGETNCNSSTAMYNAITSYLGSGNKATAGVCLTLLNAPSAATLQIGYELSGTYSGAQLIVALVESGRSNYVPAGENTGKTLKEDGVARVFKTFSISGSTGTVSITPPSNAVHNNCKVVAWLQNPTTMKMLGGTKGIDLAATTGVNSLENTSVKAGVFPNPASSDITLSYQSLVNTDVALKITDALGKVVYEENFIASTDITKNISVVDYNKGMYFVQFITSDGVTTKKVVIE